MLTLAELISRARDRGVEMAVTEIFGRSYLMLGGHPVPLPACAQDETLPNDFILYVCELSGGVLNPVDFHQDPS